jgi:hypothetical protein
MHSLLFRSFACWASTVLIVVFRCMLTIIQLLFQQNALVVVSKFCLLGIYNFNCCLSAHVDNYTIIIPTKCTRCAFCWNNNCIIVNMQGKTTIKILCMFVFVLHFCFLFSVFCDFVLFYVLFLPKYIYLFFFSICVQVYQSLPRVGNPIAVHKYHIISIRILIVNTTKF